MTNAYDFIFVEGYSSEASTHVIGVLPTANAYTYSLVITTQSTDPVSYSVLDGKLQDIGGGNISSSVSGLVTLGEQSVNDADDRNKGIVVRAEGGWVVEKVWQ